MKPEAKLRRRVFLKALAAGFTVPLAAHFARQAGASPNGRPCRLICYYFPHGVPNEHMDMEPYLDLSGDFKDFGKNAEAPLSTVHVNEAYNFGTKTGMNILSPLEPYQSMTSIVRGLYQAGSFDTHNSIGAILTGGDATDRSLDVAVAQELGIKRMGLGAVHRSDPNSIDGENGILARDEADWLIPDGDVVALNDSLFGGGTVAPPSPMDDGFRTAAIDTSIEEIASFRQTVSGLTQADDKLSAHLTALENLKSGGNGLGVATTADCSAPVISNIESLRGLDAGKQEWEPPYYLESQYFERIAEAQAEIAAYSVLCGHAQVVTVQNMWASADIPMPGVLPSRGNEGHHLGISHQSYQAGQWENQMRIDYATTQQWFMQRVARMCEILDQPDPFDPEHTALENTIIYAFSEIADGQLHGKKLEQMSWTNNATNDIFQYYPAIVVGGGGGSLQSGRIITCDNRPIGDLLLTIGQAMGVSMSTFGATGSQPFGELLA